MAVGQIKYHMVTMEDLVPQDHFLRKLDAALDLSFVYEETAGLYSHKYGRPPIDPVMLVKYLLVGFLCNIPSERDIERRIQTDVALRWYLGVDLDERVPDHSTISQLRRRKPSFRRVFRRLFEEVARQCIEKGLARGLMVGSDSTHVKANASRVSEYLEETPEEPGVFWERLDKYEEQAQAELEEKTGIRRKRRTKQVKKVKRRSHKRVSRTDPGAGHMKRPGKPRGQYYLSHQTVDTDCGIILDVTVTPGDSSDVAPYLDQIEKIHHTLLPLQGAAADAAYDAPLVHRVLEEMGIAFYVRPAKHSVCSKTEITREDFCYDPERELYICPHKKELRLTGISRSPHGLNWRYTAAREDCQSCPLKDQCLSESIRDGRKKIEDNYFAPSAKRNYARVHTPEYQRALKLRQIWCEGAFAAQKRGHNLTRVLRRGLEAAEDHCLLSATALNLKRMIKYMG